MSGFGSNFGQSNPFGSSQSQSTKSNSPSVFGQTSTQTFSQAQSSTFGNQAVGFGQVQTGAFGQSQPSGFGPTSSSGFGQTGSGGFGQTSSSGFGQTSSSGFGQTSSSGFGQTSSSGFGQTGPGGFGQTTSSSLGQTTSSGFRQTAPAFGQSSSTSYTKTQTAISIETKLTPNPFAQSSVFGQTKTSTFGQTSTAPTKNVFGSAFGTSTTPKISTSTATQSNLFAAAANVTPSGFGSSSKKSSQPTTTFGSETLFGGTSGSFGGGTVFGSKDSKGDSSFGGATTSSTSLFGGSSTKNVFGSVKTTKADNIGFGISTTAGRTSTPFGALTSSTSNTSTFGSSQGFGATKNQSEQKGPFGTTSSSQNIFGGHRKDSASSGSFVGASKAPESKNVFGGASKVSSAFGGHKTTSTVFSGPESSASKTLFGDKTSAPSSTSNIFKSARSGSSSSSSTSLFGKKNTDLPESDLVTQETSTQGQRSSTSQSQSSKPISSVFGSNKVFGSGSTSTGGFAFSTNKAERQTSADDETGETKAFAGSKTAFGGGSTLAKPSGSVFGVRSDKPTPGGFGKVKQEPGFDGESKDAESDRGRKRTIKREDEGTSKRGRSLFTSAIAGVSGSGRGGSGRIEPRPSASESANQDNQSEQEDHDAKRSSSQKLRRVPSMTEDITSKTAIVCKGVPAKFNKGAILRKHFSKYGSVWKVFTNINKNSATVHFHDHTSAAESKKRGRLLGKGIPAMQIFWSSHSPGVVRSASFTSSDPETSSRPSRSSGVKSGRSKWDDDDVDNELNSMAGTQDVQKSISRQGRQSRRVSPTPAEKPSRGQSHSPSRSSPTPSTSAGASTATSSTDIVSLSSLKSAVAKNVHEMTQILDQRDKFIREGRTKRSNLATAAAFVGTCMDMCPEKERYDREDKRRLSPYEIVLGSENIPGQNPRGDPYKMVKEYSRSSADQDEPLPHELRPIPVLKRTMEYLLSEVADKGTEGKWMDWYGFLWDRTRGIRKEITQQQLINRDAVELLEKCARFHVYCSERLIEEDMHVFDSKINNENLTKCLQTLKEMYHDLDVKHGVYCPHEAEFRAYIVLMNLNEGDTLREVQTLRPEVRNSPEIKFATKIYSALSSNNYVRFFRLVKQASFLSACIIHRYFTQVRTRALQTMIKAFGGKKAQFTLLDMVRILAFDNVEEAATFCQFYGQSVSDGMVILDKNAFYIPECAYAPPRAINLIESKLMVSAGEVMNGAALPKLEHPEPQCSFDEHGRFKISQDVLQYAGVKERKPFGAASPEKKQPSLFAAAPPTQQAAPKPAVQESKLPEEQQKEAKPAIPNEAVKMIAKELFWEVINDFVKEISQGYVSAVQLYLDAGKKTVEEIVVIGTASLIRQVCTEVFKEEQEVRQKQVEKETAECRARVSEVICQEVVEEVTQQETLIVASEQMREVKAQLKKEQEDRCTETLSEKLVEESLEGLVKEISMEVHRIDVVQRREKLDALEQCMKIHRAGRFLQVWKKEHAKRVKLKRAMLAFPCAPSSQKMDSQLKNLLPDRHNERLVERRMFVNKQAMVTIESPMEIERRNVVLNARYSLMSLYRRLMEEKAWRALDVPAIVGGEMEKIYNNHRGTDITLQESSREITWKLAVSLPEPTTSTESHINKWVCSKFQRGRVPQHHNINYRGEVLSLYHATIENKGRPPLQLGVCIRSIMGTLDKLEVERVEEKRLLLGTCGIVFVLPPDDGSDDFWSRETARLAGILHAKPVYPALPLVILSAEWTNQQLDKRELLQRLEVDSFHDDGLVEAVHVLYVSVEGGLSSIEAVLPQAADQLGASVEWLAAHMPEPPELQRARIKDYVEDVLLQEYFGPVLQNLRARKKQHALHQPPNTLICLYNCVVEHLAEVASSASLTTHSCPIAEFVWYHPQEDLPPAHWNMSDHLSNLYEEISLLQLPRFTYLNYTSDTWEQVCADVWAFVKSVLKQNKGRDSVRLVTRVKSLLRKVLSDFQDVCYLVEGEGRCEPTYINMPWTDIMDACISYRLASLPTWDTYNNQDGEERELFVYYEEDELADFAPPESWKEAVLHSNSGGECPTVLETVGKAVERKHLELSTVEEEKEEEENNSALIFSTTENQSDTSQTQINQSKLSQPQINQSDTSQTQINQSKLSQSQINQSSFNHTLGTKYSSLLSSLQVEKKESDKFEKYLEDVLVAGAGVYMDNGNYIDPITDNGQLIDPAENGQFNDPAVGNGLFRDLGQDWMVPTPNVIKNRDEDVQDQVPDEEMEEGEVTLDGRVNKFQENLFSLRQDSHLFEQRLKYLMNN